MTAYNIKNENTSPMAVGDVIIEPGRTAAVANWDSVKQNGIVSSWLEAGILVEEGKSPSPQAQEVVNDRDNLPSDKPLDEQSKSELQETAAVRGVTYEDGATKAQILEALKAAEGC